MKRTGILALVVFASALVALAWWASTRTSPHELVPATDLVHETVSTPDTPATISSTDPNAIETPRESSTRSAAEPEAAPLDASNAQAVSKSGIALASVRGLVRDGRTLEPIPRGTVNITFLLPESARGWSPPKRRLPSPGSTSITVDGPESGAKTSSTELDPHGRFELALPVGTRIHVVGASSGDRMGPPATPAECFVGVSKTIGSLLEPAGLDLVLDVSRGLVLTGIVRDAETHLPIPGAQLRLRSGLGDATSEANGSFVLGAKITRTTLRDTLDASQREHLPARLELGPEELAAKEPLLVELRPGLRVSGRVVDERGRAVAGVRLALTTSGALSELDSGSSVNSATSDSSGAFRIGPFAPSSEATIAIPPQEHGGAPIFGLRRPLGALRASAQDVVLVVASAATVCVRVEGADGAPLLARDVQVLAPGNAAVTPGRITPDGHGRLLQVPLGVELELVALAPAPGSATPGEFVHGSQRVRLEQRADEPPDVRIVLGARARFDAPPPPEGAKLLELGGGRLSATFDVQLVDASSGIALGSGKRVSLSGEGASFSTRQLVNGWVRLRGEVGRHQIEIEVDGGPRDAFECVIPVSGYGKAVWRVRTSR